MSYLHVFLIIFYCFQVKKNSAFTWCLLHMQQDLQHCVQSSCPALAPAPSSPHRLPAVGPLGSPAPWLLQFSYQCLWDQRKDYVCSSHLCPMYQGYPSSQQGFQREKKEDSAFASPGDSRAVGEGRESCGIGSGEEILAAGARLGQVSSWHRPLTRHCHTGHTHVLHSFTHILYSSLRPQYSIPRMVRQW